jgi:hypothetical protein
MKKSSEFKINNATIKSKIIVILKKTFIKIFFQIKIILALLIYSTKTKTLISTSKIVIHYNIRIIIISYLWTIPFKTNIHK